MTKEEIKDRLRLVVNKPARSLSKEDKTFLLYAGELANVQRGGKSGCVKCWHDFAMQIWHAMKEEEPQHENSEKRFILKNGVDVYFGNIRVNADTITDELAEKLLAKGLERKLFEKCE